MDGNRVYTYIHNAQTNVKQICAYHLVSENSTYCQRMPSTTTTKRHTGLEYEKQNAPKYGNEHFLF